MTNNSKFSTERIKGPHAETLVNLSQHMSYDAI